MHNHFKHKTDNIMKKLLLTFAIAALSLAGLKAEEKTKVYSFDDITGIEASYLYELHIKEGRSGKVSVVYESEYEKHLRVRYRENEGKLILELNDIPDKFKRGEQPAIHVYLEMDHITSISLTGAGKAYFDGQFTCDDLHISASGAARLSGLAIKGRNLDLDFSGASKAEVSGTFDNSVEMDISGASKGDFRIKASSLSAEFSGASNISNEGDIKECIIECSGAAKVELNGNGDSLEIEGSGACRIDTRYFKVREAYIELSGASKAEIHADEILKYNVSRVSKMVYYGNAKLVNLNNDDNVVRGN